MDTFNEKRRRFFQKISKFHLGYRVESFGDDQDDPYLIFEFNDTPMDAHKDYINMLGKLTASFIKSALDSIRSCENDEARIKYGEGVIKETRDFKIRLKTRFKSFEEYIYDEWVFHKVSERDLSFVKTKKGRQFFKEIEKNKQLLKESMPDNLESIPNTVEIEENFTFSFPSLSITPFPGEFNYLIFMKAHVDCLERIENELLNYLISLSNEGSELIIPIFGDKIQWMGSPAQFGFIFLELVRNGYIELPSYKGLGSFTHLARLCYLYFNIPTESFEYFSKQMSPTQNSLSDTIRVKFKIPER